MIQIFTDLSCLYRDVDRVNSFDYHTHQSLLDDCLVLERRQKYFYRKITGCHVDPPTYASGELKSGIPATCHLFGPAYKFSSVDEANLYICLWTTLSYVYPLLRQLQILAMADTPECLRIGDHSSEDAALRLSEFYISNAVRCLPYCAQKSMNSWAMMTGIIALTQASRVFSHLRDLERFLWTQDVVQYCARLGFDRAAQLGEIWWNYWFATDKHDFYRLPHHKDLAREYERPRHKSEDIESFVSTASV